MGLDNEATAGPTNAPSHSGRPSSEALRPVGHSPGLTGSSQPGAEIREPRPNPCSEAKPSEQPCGCKPAVKQPAPTDRPPKGKGPRNEDCCGQLIDIISRIPGIEIPPLHKPKQSPARKVNDLCDAFGIGEAILPLIAALWQRHQAKWKPRNAFETAIEKTFTGLGGDDATAFGSAVNAYLALRASGTADCLFNDCLADAAQDGPIEKEWVSTVILREGLSVATQTFFENSDGIMGPGQPRIWDAQTGGGPDSKPVIYQGPWPWLTCLAPDLNNKRVEFGNIQSWRPPPGEPKKWLDYEYAKTCTFTPTAKGFINGTQKDAVVTSCSRSHPAAVASGSFGSKDIFGGPAAEGQCEGGGYYTTKGNDCLAIPSVQPGGSTRLRGFNFITGSVSVRFTRVQDPSVTWTQECVVFGDLGTPAVNDAGEAIVDSSVTDNIDVPIPDRHPTVSNAPLPAGIYTITVAVPNVTNAIYKGSAPATLETNSLLVRIEADPHVSYNFQQDSSGSRCNRTTSGPGADEIWWDVFVGHIAPSSVAVPPQGAGGAELKEIRRVSIPRGPWEGMEQGHGPKGYPPVTLWDSKPFELGGVAVFCLVGFEVDSEDAANDELHGFWNSWATVLGDVIKEVLGAGGMVSGIAGVLRDAGLITARVLSATLIGLAVAAFIGLVCTAFWAAWAEADLVALDILTLDSTRAWDFTDPTVPLPPAEYRTFGDPYDEDNPVSVASIPQPKLASDGDFQATWRQLNRYVTPDDGEDSNYTLAFSMSRGTII